MLRGPRFTVVLRCAILVAFAGCGGRIALEDVGTDGDAGSLPSGAGKPPANDLPPAPAWDARVPFVDAWADAVVDPPTDAGAHADADADAKDCSALPSCGDDTCVDLQTDPANCGACGITCGGTCALGRCIVTLASGQDHPFAMAIDGTNVYWTNRGDEGPNAGSVRSVPLAGGPVMTLAVNQTRPWYIVSNGTKVFWSNPPNLMSVDVGGGPPTAFATGTAPIGVTVDADYVYWIDAMKGGLGQLWKRPLAGGDATLLSDTGSNPGRVVVSDVAAFYFNMFGTDRVDTTPLAGGTRTYFKVFGALGAALSGIAIDANNLYATFNNSGGAVVACPLPDGACTTIANGNNGAQAIATDGAFAYFLSPHGGPGALTGVIRKVPVGGGPKEVIVVGGHDLQDVAVDATSLYWINNAAGTVMKVTPK